MTSLLHITPYFLGWFTQSYVIIWSPIYGSSRTNHLESQRRFLKDDYTESIQNEVATKFNNNS
jgi:hypothetical protein